MTPLPSSFPAIPDRFAGWWLVFCIGWVLAVWIVSAVVRVGRGRPIFRPRPAGVRFAEGWRSGRSYRNMLTRLAGARSCLWVTVTADELLVGPHFPFSLGFLPEVYGLEYRIRGGDIL